MTKYVFITGGVTSSLGKGIIAASLAKLLQSRGFSVTIQKFDPYINVDPGTLNPYEHGECYVTNDGAETDLDLGHYERFLNIPTTQGNNVTTGRIYQTVIDKERAGDFLGKTVQVIPHITDEIKRRIALLSESGKFEIIITEIGGTVGDIESLPYLEAIRQFRHEMKDNDTVLLHLTLVPFLSAAKELKTKPTQHSVKELQTTGIQPDVLVCRTEHHIHKEIRQKLALFCNVDKNSVIEAIDAESIYDVPLLMLKEGLDRIVLNKLHLKSKHEPELEVWKSFLTKLKHPIREVNIGLIGKYHELRDAYKSIYEAFVHAGAVNECKVNIQAIHSESLENLDKITDKLENLDGILIAPGFGERGIEGKYKAIEYARTHNIPFFGICLGLQSAVVEFARNVLGIKDAASTEVNPATKNPVIDMMADQKKITVKGGTMRLGAYECKIKKDSKAYKMYGSDHILERHRHRWEFNNKYLEQFEEAGFRAVGTNPQSKLVEIMELKSHPFFIGVQFHPELRSTVEDPHPIFVGFIQAAMNYRGKLQTTERTKTY